MRRKRKLADVRKVAEQLKIARNLRSATEQLDLLDDKLGKGKGAKKERKRLASE